MFGAEDQRVLAQRLRTARGETFALSPAGLRDLSGSLASALPPRPPARAAVVATSPNQLAKRLDELTARVEDGVEGTLAGGRGAFVGVGRTAPVVGLMFSGQGAPVRVQPGALGDVCEPAAAVYEMGGLPPSVQELAVDRVQLAVVLSSLSALAALDSLGVSATFALGHSLGELTALHWAGALDRPALLRTARARGEAMTRHVADGGGMATVDAEGEVLLACMEGLDVNIACLNSSRQHVISGGEAAIESVVARAREAGARALRLNVTGAFHSPRMDAAVPVFERHLAKESFKPLQRRIISTVTGGWLDPQADLRQLLARQITEPVVFAQAAAIAAAEADLLIEAGPGGVLAGLLGDAAGRTPAVSVRAGDRSVRGIYEVVAAAWAAGSGVIPRSLVNPSPAVRARPPHGS